jgi:putative FmdB family regulatory protein
MPAYEYLCETCKGQFERRQKMSEPEVKNCPNCGGSVKRLISGGAGAIVKGSGAASAAGPAKQCPGLEMGCGNACGCGH